MQKKKLIIASILGSLLLLIGIFYLGRISVEKQSLEPKNNLPPQKPEKLVNQEPTPSGKNEGKFDYRTFF